MEVSQESPSASDIRCCRYQLRVRTGNQLMDQIVFEQARLHLGKVIEIAEQASGDSGAIEVTFTSSSQSAFVGTSTAFANTAGYVDGWYTGNAASFSGSASTVATRVTTGSTFTWQNSTMFVTLKNPEGKRLRTTQYNYKGGWEFSGWVVNTPDEASNLCLKRIAQRLSKDLKRR
jgi:hypothetical protein